VSVALTARCWQVRTELDAAGDDARVAALVAEAAAAAMASLGEAVDAQLATGPEARQVLTSCTPLQARNLQLVASLQAVAAGLAPVAAAAPLAAGATLTARVNRTQARVNLTQARVNRTQARVNRTQAAAAALASVAAAALAPLFKAVGSRLEACLLKMHADEGLGGGGATATTDASKYMDETVAVLAFFAKEFLAPLGGGGAAAAVRVLTQHRGRWVVGRAAHGVGAVQAQREVGGGESSTRRGCGASTEGGGCLCKPQSYCVVRGITHAHTAAGKPPG
jgi:hypothetical protein